jgi:hypothetical protein
MHFLPSQSVNDLRYHDGDGTVMTYIIQPSEAPGPALPPSAVTWTPPV